MVRKSEIGEGHLTSLEIVPIEGASGVDLLVRSDGEMMRNSAVLLLTFASRTEYRWIFLRIDGKDIRIASVDERFLVAPSRSRITLWRLSKNLVVEIFSNSRVIDPIRELRRFNRRIVRERICPRMTQCSRVQ